MPNMWTSLHTGTLQGPVGGLQIHTAHWCGLRRDFHPGHQACDHSHRAHHAVSRRWTTKRTAWCLQSILARSSRGTCDVSTTHGLRRFFDTVHPDTVCLLDKSLYGLRQAPHAWFHQFTADVLKLRFAVTRSNSSLFTLCHGNDIIYLLLYKDDIVLAGSSSTLLQHAVNRLCARVNYSSWHRCQVHQGWVLPVSGTLCQGHPWTRRHE